MDELVGVGAVDVRSWWPAGGVASLAGDGQAAAGFMDGVVAVQQRRWPGDQRCCAACGLVGVACRSGALVCGCGALTGLPVTHRPRICDPGASTAPSGPDGEGQARMRAQTSASDKDIFSVN